MDALVMCGGAGSRLESECEKPLLEIGGRPTIDAVVDALGESRIDRTTAVVSPMTPRTREHLEVSVVDAPGDGYVADLQYALDRVELPVLTVVADLPLLPGALIDDVLSDFEARPSEPSLTVCVPVALKDVLGASVDTTLPDDGRQLAPTGLNVVAAGADEATVVSWDTRLAVNVNRPSDAVLAEALR